MQDTRLIFILGSGRCGTKAIAKMLTGAPGLEAHHEYCRYAYQREAVLYYIKQLPRLEMQRIFRDIYGSAAYYSEQSQFLDSSHKLVWAADVLVKLFPDAKFVHLVRDGRKVASSFFYKLQIHDDRAAGILREWATKGGVLPPPSEKYWWPPVEGERFERICHYWALMNTHVEKCLEKVPAERRLRVRLEDLTSMQIVLDALLDFVGVDASDTYWQSLQRPDHVYVPIDMPLTDEQRATFNSVCGETMAHYGYNITEREYRVNY